MRQRLVRCEKGPEPGATRTAPGESSSVAGRERVVGQLRPDCLSRPHTPPHNRLHRRAGDRLWMGDGRAACRGARPGGVGSAVPGCERPAAVGAHRSGPEQGLVQASLSAEFPNMVFQADVGSYSKNLGNASLTESSAGFVSIGTVVSDLCDRTIDSGNGKVLGGSIPITYKAVATSDLDAGSSARTLTITLTDT